MSGGQQANFGQGTLTAHTDSNVTVGLTGQLLTSSLGALGKSNTHNALTGQSITAAQTSIGPSHDVDDLYLSISAGILTPQGGDNQSDITLELSGIGMNFGMYRFPIPAVASRKRRPKARLDPERERAIWLGLPPPEQAKVVEPAAITPVAAPAEYFVSSPGHGFGLSAAGSVSSEIGRISRVNIGFAPSADVTTELGAAARNAPFTMVTDQSKIISSTTQSGGGGFKFGTRHHVEYDLWLDRPITNEERTAILKKLKP